MSHSVPTSSNCFGSRPDDVPHMTKLLADVSIASTAPEPPEIQVDAGRSEAEPYTSGLLVSSSFDDTDSSIMNIDGSVYDSEDGYVTDESTVGSISVPPSILHHMFEDGIRCHAFRDRRYAFPNDENEQNRDDMKHAMTVLLCDNRLHFAPIDSNPQKVIDLGTGSGMWALEMADVYPSAEVIGVNLSPTQTSWVPPNLKFLIDDIEDDWLYSPKRFDYVHTRHTMHSVQDPVKLI